MPKSFAAFTVDMPLLSAMRAYDETGRLRFHMPGHNGKLPFDRDFENILPAQAFHYDVTELEGLDVLSQPEGCLFEAQRLAAQAFGVAHSFFLVNGATVGIEAGMLSVLRPGDKVLLPRNAHRSALNGLILCDAEPVWFLPEHLESAGLWGAVSPETIERHLSEQPDIRLLLITSPTYEGVGSDIEAILAVSRRYGVAVIVDEAHGSLWPFSKSLPKSACHAVAKDKTCDLVVHSLHKSAGSLTQTAMAHLPAGSAIAPERFQDALNTLQSTSPSYLLMASLDSARAFLDSTQGRQAVDVLLRRAIDLREAFNHKARQFELWEPASQKQFWDPTRLWIRHRRFSGDSWAVRIESELPPERDNLPSKAARIAYESTSPDGALYLCGLGLDEEDYEKFLATFTAWDSFDFNAAGLGRHAPSHAQSHLVQSFCLPEMALTPRSAFFASAQSVSPPEAVGRISKQSIVHCPPGVPVLMPGERISDSHLPHLPPTVQVVARLP